MQWLMARVGLRRFSALIVGTVALEYMYLYRLQPHCQVIFNFASGKIDVFIFPRGTLVLDSSAYTVPSYMQRPASLHCTKSMNLMSLSGSVYDAR